MILVMSVCWVGVVGCGGWCVWWVGCGGGWGVGGGGGGGGKEGEEREVGRFPALLTKVNQLLPRQLQTGKSLHALLLLYVVHGTS